MNPTQPRHPAIAGVLSGIVPGLGQFYCRQWEKGAGFLVGAIATDYGSGLSNNMKQFLLERTLPQDTTIFIAGSCTFLAIAVWSITDAVRTAKKSH